MGSKQRTWLWWTGVVGLFAVPAAHPLLIPYLGVPSHLLWWVHVLPVALLAFRAGRVAGVAAWVLSAALVAAGERTFGAGYGIPADADTVAALTTALAATNLLVLLFALYARRVSARYRLLLEHVGIGVLQTDAGGVVEHANPAAMELLGATDAAQVVGRPVLDILRPQGVDSIEALEDCRGWSGELDMRTPDGPRMKHAFLLAVRDPESGRIQLLVADRSTEVMQERELERQAKLASLGEALAGVAHELKNPLTAIVAHAQLGLMDAPGATPLRESFEVIAHEADRMKTIVGELLGFSRAGGSSGRADLPEVVTRLARVQQIAVGRRIRVREEIRWRGSVAAGALKIEQVLLNLISNAVDAVGDVPGGDVRVVVEGSDGMARVHVEDNGPGIDPRIADRMFEPFQTTKPAGKGTGLGLPISRRLARSWGGDLTAVNLDPRGARFTLTIPVATAEASSAVEGADALRSA